MSVRQIWVAFATLVRYEVRRFMRIWIQTLVPPVITMGLYFLIFGDLIGSRIGTMQGFSYAEFVAPGLIMLSVITSAYANTSSSFFSAKFQGNIQELLVAPVPSYVILAGFLFGAVLRALLVAVLVSILASMFVDLRIHSWPIALSAVFLTALLFALLGFINGVYANHFDDISIVPSFVLAPLTYLGGVFYTTALLPPFWHALSHGNPVLYMVNAFRYGLLGISDTNLVLSYSLIIGIIIAGLALSLWLLSSSTRLRN